MIYFYLWYVGCFCQKLIAREKKNLFTTFYKQIWISCQMIVGLENGFLLKSCKMRDILHSSIPEFLQGIRFVTWSRYTQYHLISTTFISTKYLTFQNLRTISTGFGKIKDQKIEIAFIHNSLHLSYLTHKIIDFETTKLAFSMIGTLNRNYFPVFSYYC